MASTTNLPYNGTLQTIYPGEIKQERRKEQKEQNWASEIAHKPVNQSSMPETQEKAEPENQLHKCTQKTKTTQDQAQEMAQQLIAFVCVKGLCLIASNNHGGSQQSVTPVSGVFF